MILRFNQYILEEHSKNEPILEIRDTNKLGIILMGSPGIGKSTFIKNYILPKRNDIKTFSTDDVSFAMTKSVDDYYPKASELNLDRLNLFIGDGKPFIYDTTGTNVDNLKKVFTQAKNSNYRIIFIHLIGNKEQAEAGNLARIRKVSNDYLELAHGTQATNSKIYMSWNPDAYYFVARGERGYIWWKMINNQLKKRGDLGEWQDCDQEEIYNFF
jgi:predicted kinase